MKHYDRSENFEHVRVQLSIKTYRSLLVRFLDAIVVLFVLRGQG